MLFLSDVSCRFVGSPYMVTAIYHNVVVDSDNIFSYSMLSVDTDDRRSRYKKTIQFDASSVVPAEYSLQIFRP
ncbi:MAG: hypothetical protein RR458_03235, partial [Clostridia bacterium]